MAKTEMAIIKIATKKNLDKDNTNQKRIVKDLENAKIAAQNVLEDLQVEKEKLAEAIAKNETILASIADGCIAVNEKGEIILINQMAQKMLGYTSKESIGKHWHEILHREDENGNPISPENGAIQAALSATTTTTTTTTTTDITSFYYLRKDGSRFPVSRTVSPIILRGKIIGVINIFRDITQEKELDRAKSEFISIASHQLRTPVAGLSWLTEALQFASQNLSPKQKTYVKNLSTLSKRLIVLVEDLLNLSRIQLKTPLMTEKSPIDISGFVEEFIKEIELYAKSKKHTIIFNKNIVGPLTIEINKKSLYNVLQNLISNAIEYSPENTAVTVNLERIDDFIKISVSNKGPAIPEDEKPRIFERFYRGESAKKIKAEGTGLGLYIIKTIVESMGGKVGFSSGGGSASGGESSESKDTTFWFSIPLKNKIL